MEINVKLLPFSFPNFIRIDIDSRETDGNRVKVGKAVHEFTDEQAEAYWDAMKPQWLEHVSKKRELNRKLS